MSHPDVHEDSLPAKFDPPKRSKLALVVFWGGAAFLAPWIVALYITQKDTGTGHHLRFVGIGISVCLLIGMAVTARLIAHHSKMALLSAAFCGTLAFITAWFGSVSTVGGWFWVLLAYAFVVLLPVTITSFWLVWFTYTRRGVAVRFPSWIPTAYRVGAATLLVPIIIVAVAIQPAHAAVNLRLVWTGLDCFELVFLVASGVFVWRRSSAVAVSAMCLGTLMFADAWYNIFATTGAAMAAAIVMAFGELPLSGYSVYAAHHEVRRWPKPDGKGADDARMSSLDSDQQP